MEGSDHVVAHSVTEIKDPDNYVWNMKFRGKSYTWEDAKKYEWVFKRKK